MSEENSPPPKPFTSWSEVPWREVDRSLLPPVLQEMGDVELAMTLADSTICWMLDANAPMTKAEYISRAYTGLVEWTAELDSLLPPFLQATDWVD